MKTVHRSVVSVLHLVFLEERVPVKIFCYASGSLDGDAHLSDKLPLYTR